MRPTKTQIKELAQLVSTGPDDEEAANEFVVEFVTKYWELMAEQKLFAGLRKVGGIIHAYGPFTTQGQVVRAQGTPVPFVTPEGWKRALAKADEGPALPKGFSEVAEDAARFKAKR